MAQTGSAQREPSMEEILASIRRIIEDSDGGAKPEEQPEIVSPDNDALPSAVAANSWPPETQSVATVIEVDAFRAELRTALLETPAPFPPVRAASDARRPISLSEVQAQVAADQIAAREAAERAYHGEVQARKAAVAPATPVAEVAPARREADKQEWHLGAQPAPVASGPAREEDRQRREETMNAVLDDISARQTRPAAPDIDPDAFVSTEPQQAPQPAAQAEQLPTLEEDDLLQLRPAIISTQTGMQVAAAFGELSEAFAARSQKTFDDMAAEMMRPMLQDWLDNNLPILVERLVREEIERVARGG